MQGSAVTPKGDRGVALCEYGAHRKSPRWKVTCQAKVGILLALISQRGPSVEKLDAFQERLLDFQHLPN